MTDTPGIDKLYAVMTQVFGNFDFCYNPEMTAADVPGWDSLHHTILMIEIERVMGVELSAYETSSLANIGALWDVIVQTRWSATGSA